MSSVRRAERIVFALRALGETRKAAALADGADAVAAAGQDLVRVRLVADIPDQPGVRGVEHVMEATVNSTTPRLSPKCPPVIDTASISSARSSSASCRRSSSRSLRKSAGISTRSSNGVRLEIGRVGFESNSALLTYGG